MGDLRQAVWAAAASALLLPGITRAEMNTVPVGQGSYGRSTSVGDNRQGFSAAEAFRSAFEGQNQGPAPDIGGGGGGGYEGPLAIDGEPPPRPPSFRELVEEARQSLPRGSRAELVALLREGEDPSKVAVLAADAAGEVEIPEADVIEVLEATRRPEVARACVTVLGRRKTPRAWAAMEKHVIDRGPGDNLAVKLLWAAGPPRGKDGFLARAGEASGKDETSLLCIRALALMPGEDVTVLLRRLLEDWSPQVTEAAAKARQLRKEAGMQADVAVKKPPVGAYYREVLEPYNPSDFQGVRGGSGLDGTAPPESAHEH